MKKKGIVQKQRRKEKKKRQEYSFVYLSPRFANCHFENFHFVTSHFPTHYFFKDENDEEAFLAPDHIQREYVPK